MFSERSTIPKINTASANSTHFSTPTPNSPVKISRFPSAASSLTTSPATSGNSPKAPSTSSDPRAVRVVSLLNALGPSPGPIGQRPRSHLSPPQNPPPRPHYAQEGEVGSSMVRSRSYTTKSGFLDRFSGSPSLGSGSSSTPSSELQSEKKAARMVGRGGSGSKIRSVNTDSDSPSDISIKRVKSNISGVSVPSVPSLGDGKVRYVGRGGQGSKQRTAKDEQEEEQADEVPGMGLKLPWKKAKTSKTKRTHDPGDGNSANAHDSNYRSMPRRKSEASDASRDTLASSSASPSSPRSPYFGGMSVSSLGSIEEKPHGASISVKPSSFLHPGKYDGGSLNKLAQKMGELPPYLTHQQVPNQHGPRDENDLVHRLDIQNPKHRPTHSTALPSIPFPDDSTRTITQHPVVNILSSLGPTLKSSHLRSESTTSSLETTRSCELRQYGLVDHPSEVWGKVKDDDHDCYAEDVGWEDVFEAPSPIAFSPPSPVDRKRAAARCRACHIETGMELGGNVGDAISEFSAPASVTDYGRARGIGTMRSEDEDETADATGPDPAETSNGNSLGASCHHGTHLYDVKDDSSTPPSHHPVQCSYDVRPNAFAARFKPTQSPRDDSPSGRLDEQDDDINTPVAERARGAAHCSSLAEKEVGNDSDLWHERSSSFRDPSWMPPNASSSFQLSPPSRRPPALTLSRHTVGPEHKSRSPSSLPSPSASSFAVSTTSLSISPPHSATYPPTGPNIVPPNSPFSSLTPLRLPASSVNKHLKRGGSVSSTRSFRSDASSSYSQDSFERSLAAQARRVSHSADSMEEDDTALAGSDSPQAWQRSIDWGEEDLGQDGWDASNSAAGAGESDIGKGKDKGPQLWIGEWNTDMDDVIRALRML